MDSRAQKIASDSPIVASINEISLPGPAVSETNDDRLKKQGYESTTLFSTTPFAGQEDANLSIAPDQDFPKTDLATRTVAVELSSTSAQEGRPVLSYHRRQFQVSHGSVLSWQQSGDLSFGVSAWHS